MRKRVVSACITLDRVFDADTMMEWFAPFDSLERHPGHEIRIEGSSTLIKALMEAHLAVVRQHTVTSGCLNSIYSPSAYSALRRFRY